MKRILVGVASIASMLATGALAADLPVKAPPIPVAVYNWTGFIGGNVGGSWGREHNDGTLTGMQNVSVFRTAGPNLVTSVTTPLAVLPIVGRSDVNGFIGGGQAGYNWQRDKWVFGLEGDLQGSSERSNGSLCTAIGCPPRVGAVQHQLSA
jgi:outer membrane immunogenic protein